MFSRIFDDLIMTASLAEELANFNAFSRREKDTPKEGERTSYHYKEWKDGKPVFECSVEWKDGKKETDSRIDYMAGIKDKTKEMPKAAEASKKAETPKETIDAKDAKIKELEQQIEALTNEKKELIRKNADYITKLAKIKNLF